MAVQVTLYSWLQALSTALSVGLALVSLAAAWRRPSHRTSLLFFSGYTAFASVWAAGYGLMISSETLPAKILGWQVTDVGAAFVPALWLLFALVYTGRFRRHVRPLSVVLGTVAVGFSTAVVVAPVPTLLRPLGTSVATGPLGTQFVVLQRTFSTPFFAWAIWSHLLVLAGAAVFVRYLQTNRDTYRGQAVLLVTAAAVPVAASLAFFTGVTPHQLNFTSLSFAVSGIVFWVAIRRYRLLDVVPVARESVIEDMRDGFVVVDERWTVVDTNPAARELTPGDGPTVGNRITDALPEAARVLDGETDRTEVTVETDAGRRYLDLSVSKLSGRNDDGTLLVLQDVTERRSTERHYQTLIEHSSDLITLLDADGTIRYESPSVEQVLGYEPGERIGQSAFENIHPEDRGRLAAEFERGVEQPGYTSRAEFRIQHADGSWRVHEGIARNLLHHPDVEGIVVNSRDVTEQKRREREVRAERERLDRFASVVSHDLRNPLTVATGNLELLEPHVDPDGEQFLESVRESHERMDDLIEDALSMAREGRAVDDVESVSLESVARDAWSGVETGDATLDVETSATVDADRSRLVRVFENLFRNAVEH
ncbi:histidine kinase N-terminal 7TM domain-containing protein, partial [Haloarculaceae archaeon H-GB1-1]|nr:histidine kinase N-terminal 7TM domain-containing protein [Haloarculaceae archaeon H-GB1-1]